MKQAQSNQSNETVERDIRAALDTIRPELQADGGDLQFVRFDGQTLYIKLLGACQACPFAQFTLFFTVEAAIKRLVPAVQKVKIEQ